MPPHESRSVLGHGDWEAKRTACNPESKRFLGEDTPAESEPGGCQSETKQPAGDWAWSQLFIPYTAVYMALQVPAEF